MRSSHGSVTFRLNDCLQESAAFILWATALERATPTRVANTMTVNPIAAALLAALLMGEPITIDLVFGLIAVFAGIWLATSQVQKL